MAFRTRIEQNPETLAEFELAWQRRFEEGMSLLENENTRSGGVYLLGYVGEMVLKSAYFRFMGEGSYAVVPNLLQTSNFKTKAANISISQESGHSILFWTEILIIVRDQEHRRLPSSILRDLRVYSTTLHDNWLVDMRYHSLGPTGQEWRDVQDAVEWFQSHHESLWR